MEMMQDKRHSSGLQPGIMQISMGCLQTLTSKVYLQNRVGTSSIRLQVALSNTDTRHPHKVRSNMDTSNRMALLTWVMLAHSTE